MDISPSPSPGGIGPASAVCDRAKLRGVVRVRLAILIVSIAVTGCGGESLSPANVAAAPGGTQAVSFTHTFPPGFWEEGEHAYRMVIVCPAQSVGPPVVRFEVSNEAPQVGTAYLRFDGPGRHVLSPADLPAVHPDDTTVAVVTLAGMTETDVEGARTNCDGSVVYDGLDPETLEPGEPFQP